MVDKVLPHLSYYEEQATGNDLQILQSLAGIVSFISPSLETEKIEACQNAVFDVILKYVPPPPEEIDTAAKSNEGQISHIESILYTFHQLCKFNPTYYTEMKAETLRDFRLRLQYLGQG